MIEQLRPWVMSLLKDVEDRLLIISYVMNDRSNFVSDSRVGQSRDEASFHLTLLMINTQVLQTMVLIQFRFGRLPLKLLSNQM